ncbi:MTH865 family protein [Halobium salinum]|uniref:MTH865 family protein n=1 Tax=Halobium salinum TaxID=1364940 RepID=A0ABD5PDG2_9EURY|nr:MTH865 family protein [Halobium salinum]
MASEEVESELRTQLLEAFSGADYPVSNQMDLVPALPNGPGTKFEAGDGEVSFTAMEMAAKLGSHQEFPYDSAEKLVDDVMEGLREEGML